MALHFGHGDSHDTQAANADTAGGGGDGGVSIEARRQAVEKERDIILEAIGSLEKEKRGYVRQIAVLHGERKR
jgi:hypothetical protein